MRKGQAKGLWYNVIRVIFRLELAAYECGPVRYIRSQLLQENKCCSAFGLLARVGIKGYHSCPG